MNTTKKAAIATTVLQEAESAFLREIGIAAEKRFAAIDPDYSGSYETVSRFMGNALELATIMGELTGKDARVQYVLFALVHNEDVRPHLKRSAALSLLDK